MPEPRRDRSVRPGDEGRWAAVTSDRPAVLEPGPERDTVVRATFRQHPFPGNVLHRLAAGHVSAAGVYVRLEPVPVADE